MKNRLNQFLLQSVITCPMVCVVSVELGLIITISKSPHYKRKFTIGLYHIRIKLLSFVFYPMKKNQCISLTLLPVVGTHPQAFSLLLKI